MHKRSSILRLLLLLAIASTLGACQHYYTDARYDMQQMRVDNLVPDSATASIIAPYKNVLDAQMGAVVCTVGIDLNRAKPESLLGNAICDMMVSEVARITGEAINFGVYNYGGIRQEFLNKGPLTTGKVYELLPFENFGAVVTMSGTEVAQLVQKIIDEGGWPVSGGIKIIITDNKASQVFINGNLLDPNGTYRVAMNDYMANGGDNLSFIIKENVVVLGTTIRDMFLHYAATLQSEGKVLESSIEGRIQYDN